MLEEGQISWARVWWDRHDQNPLSDRGNPYQLKLFRKYVFQYVCVVFVRCGAWSHSGNYNMNDIYRIYVFDKCGARENGLAQEK